MKICDIVQFYSSISGGVKRYIYNKSHFASKNPGFEHIIIVPGCEDNLWHDFGCRRYEVKSPRLPGSVSYRILVSKQRIIEIIRDEKPDVIEVGDPYRAAWIGLEAGKRFNIPVVAFYHSDYPRALGRTIRKFAGRSSGEFVQRLTSSYIKRLYNKMDITVTSSLNFYQILQEIGIEKLELIPLGVDKDIFYPRDSRQRIIKTLYIQKDAKILLYVGRIAREKNIKELISVMDSELSEGYGCHLVLIGDGELRRHVIRASQKNKNIHWLPYADSSDYLAEFYSAADCFLHMGLNETFGLASLEAQACGARVLAVKGGGLEATLEGESHLIMAKGATAQDFINCLKDIFLLNETNEERLRRSHRIHERFSSETTYQNLFLLYKSLIARKKKELISAKQAEWGHELAHKKI